MELPGVMPLLVEILLVAFAGGANIILYLWNNRIKALEEAHKALRRDVDHIKYNYLDRFEDVKDHISNMQLLITERIVILEAKLMRNS